MTTSKPTYKIFERYDNELPDLEGFVDDSYINNVCPSIRNDELRLEIFVDYKDTSLREFPEANTFRINPFDENGEPGADDEWFYTDSLDEVKDYIEARRAKLAAPKV